VLLSVAQGVPPGNGNNLAIDPEGNLIETGNFPIPAAETVPANAIPAPTPPQCLPGQGVYALRISSQNGGVLVTQILPGAGAVGSFVDSQGNIYVGGSTALPDIPLTPGVVYDQAATGRTISGGFLERTNFTRPASAVGCVTDAANLTILGPIAPGQLITIFGNGIGPAQPVTGVTAGATTVSTSIGGVSVTFNGQPAPILYASSNQINVQAPFEIDQNPYTTAENTVMQLSWNGAVLATQAFAVTPQNPGLFVGSSVQNLVCATSQVGNALIAVALNEDGSFNSCANPAASGSQFTLFVNGIGTAANGGNGATGLLTVTPESDNATVSLLSGAYSLEVDAFTDEPDTFGDRTDHRTRASNHNGGWDDGGDSEYERHVGQPAGWGWRRNRGGKRNSGCGVCQTVMHTPAGRRNSRFGTLRADRPTTSFIRYFQFDLDRTEPKPALAADQGQ
jgi:uncharacterized protein (TIGR03437 family)